MLHVHVGHCFVQNWLSPKIVNVIVLLVEVAATSSHAEFVNIYVLINLGFSVAIVRVRMLTRRGIAELHKGLVVITCGVV
jgi:hypothetical protein